MLIIDVDGVLTDAGMYYSEKGDELKKFNTRDGMGIELWRNAGFKTAIITNEKTKIVERRAKKLKVDDLCQNAKNKMGVTNQLLNKYNLAYDEIAYIGDDINDIPLLKKVGFSSAPLDAMGKVKKIVDYICKKKGGEGAVREIIDWMLNEKNKD